MSTQGGQEADRPGGEDGCAVICIYLEGRGVYVRAVRHRAFLPLSDHVCYMPIVHSVYTQQSHHWLEYIKDEFRLSFFRHPEQGDLRHFGSSPSSTPPVCSRY